MAEKVEKKEVKEVEEIGKSARYPVSRESLLGGLSATPLSPGRNYLLPPNSPVASC